MASSIERKKGQRLWRVRWREGGRGSKRHSSEWFKERRFAEEFQERLSEIQDAAEDTSGKLVISWSVVRAKWLATKKGRYRDESKSALENHTDHWATTSDATPEAMSKLPIGPMRVARACIKWAWLILHQPMDLRAMKVAPVRVRPKKARKPPLTEDEAVMGYIQKAAGWSAGNGAICHLIALYSTRAQSLVGLTGDAFDGSGLTFLNKNGEIERQVLVPWTVAILQALDPKPGKPLFYNHLGEQWKTGQAFSVWFHHHIGEGVGWKELLRCTSMSRMLGFGFDNKTVSSVSKHQTPSLISDVYARTNEANEQKVVDKIAAAMAPFSGPRLVSR